MLMPLTWTLIVSIVNNDLLNTKLSDRDLFSNMLKSSTKIRLNYS